MVEKKFNVEYPVALEITLEAENQHDMANLCLEGLKLAVKEHKMTAETASDYYKLWFEKDMNFYHLTS